MRPYTKQKPFSRPSSAPRASASSSADGALPLAYLDRVSVFETMRAYGGRIFRVDEHLSRLEDSCRAVGHEPPAKAAELRRWLEESLKDSGASDATLRVSAHWEDPSTSSGQSGRFVVFVTPFAGHPAAWYEKGVSLRTAVPRRWTLKAQDPQVKSSNYVSGVIAMLDHVGATRRVAPTQEAHELLFFGSPGTVAEGTVSNLFIVKGKRLLTPSVASGILKGVTRGIVIRLAEKRGLEVCETELTRHEFYAADECFLTNTSSEVLPVVKIDGRSIGSGKPGPVTKALADDFQGVR